MMDSFATLELLNSFTDWIISTSSTIARWKSTGEPKGSHLGKILSAGGAKLEIAPLFKPWVFQAYLGTEDGAKKHQNQAS